ncbi:MAG: fumarate reductase subunit C [Proteobacteria bacterium]|nr:fumarate reductase subunit C [Pseudomonadota bacterium]
MESHRKPYIREVKRSWWLSNPTYKRYMLREGTAFFSLLIAIELLAFCLIPVIYPENGAEYIAGLIQNPAIIILNIIGLLSTLYHAVTWFNVMPKAVRLFRSRDPKETRLVPARFFIVLLWSLTICASAVIALALIFAV